jgi:ArsR family transcriptional regulator
MQLFSTVTCPACGHRASESMRTDACVFFYVCKGCGVRLHLMARDMNPVVIFSALAEPVRIEALRMVWDGREHCVCELMRELGASQSRMSRHMAALKTAGLVVGRRDAQWVRYRRSPNLPQEVVRLVDAALALPVNQERHAA